jgi:hypothetical protein
LVAVSGPVLHPESVILSHGELPGSGASRGKGNRMVDVAVRLYTPVYIQHRNAGGLSALVSILAVSDSTTISQPSSSEEQHHSSSFSVYNAINAEANYSALGS